MDSNTIGEEEDGRFPILDLDPERISDLPDLTKLCGNRQRVELHSIRMVVQEVPLEAFSEMPMEMLEMFFYGRTEFQKTTEIELNAILVVINIARRLNIDELTVQSDSLNAISMINGKSKPPADLKEKVNEINTLSQGYEFKHVYREANQVADYLASLGDKNGIQEFNEPWIKNMDPSILARLYELLEVDRSRKIYHRKTKLRRSNSTNY